VSIARKVTASLEASSNASSVLEPDYRALDDVTAIGVGVEHEWATWPALVEFMIFENDWGDPTAAKPVVDPRYVVAFIASHP
jgi:hypothetical protein